MAVIIDSDLSAEYTAFKNYMRLIDETIKGIVADMAASDYDADAIVAMYRRLGTMKSRLNAFAAIPGIEAYAQTVEGDAGYALLLEIAAVVTAVTAAMTWIDTNFPKSNDYLLYMRIIAEELVPRSFTVAQTTGLRSALTDIEDLIGV